MTQKLPHSHASFPRHGGCERTGVNFFRTLGRRVDPAGAARIVQPTAKRLAADLLQIQPMAGW
jgi:hypothetical protein